MRRSWVSGLSVVVISLALTSACSLRPIQPDRASQQAALQRWSDCLERFGAKNQGSISSLKHHTQTVCGGHRRDVLATFPIHLENQVDTILSNKTRVFTSRLVKTGLGDSLLLEAR